MCVHVINRFADADRKKKKKKKKNCTSKKIFYLNGEKSACQHGRQLRGHTVLSEYIAMVSCVFISGSGTAKKM